MQIVSPRFIYVTNYIKWNYLKTSKILLLSLLDEKLSVIMQYF